MKSAKCSPTGARYIELWYISGWGIMQPLAAVCSNMGYTHDRALNEQAVLHCMNYGAEVMLHRVLKQIFLHLESSLDSQEKVAV